MELNAAIPVRSERQALEWSLVLVSQGIETAIDQAPETGLWSLRVPQADLENARAALRQYWRENRRRIWQQPMRWTGLVFDWRALAWFCFLLAIFFLDEHGLADLKSVGMMDNAAVRQGQWWRLFTALTLHADVGHLAGNASTGILLLGLTMGCYGAGTGLLMAGLAGAGGNLAALLLFQSHRSLGASGMVLGTLGLLAVHSITHWRMGATTRELAGRSLMAGVLLLVLLGLNPRTDVLAHVAGFASGCVLGLGWALLPERWHHQPRLDHACALLSVGIILAAWLSALLGRTGFGTVTR